MLCRVTTGNGDDLGILQSTTPSVARWLPSEWAESRIAVVVPTYNEVHNLPVLAERLLALPLPQLRLVVVDDDSPDGTGRVADAIAERRPERVDVLHRAVKDGLGRAHIAGMRAAIAGGARYVVQMDGDLSHEPEAIPELLGTALATGAGLVIGSRYVVGGSTSDRWATHRRWLSKSASTYVNLVLRLNIRDATGGFKLWRADVLESIGLAGVVSDGFSFQIEMNYRCRQLGYKLVEIPIHFAERHSGRSKISARIQLEALALPWRLKMGPK